MGDEYKLPSGLASCLWYNRHTGESECLVPPTGYDRNKALHEALEQLHMVKQDMKDLESMLLDLADTILNRPTMAEWAAKCVFNQLVYPAPYGEDNNG
jgi:hypothetical protein